MVLNYTDIKYIEKITNSNIFFLWHQDDWMSESRFFLLNTLLIYFTRFIRCWFFLNVQYHIKHFKRNIYISYSILVNELFIFIERELELEIKEKYRGDMQRRHPGTYSMQKQTTSSVPYYGMKKNCANEQLVISTKTNIYTSGLYWFLIYFLFLCIARLNHKLRNEMKKYEKTSSMDTFFPKKKGPQVIVLRIQ